MSDLDIVIKALRDTADDLYRYQDSLKDAGAEALAALARRIEEVRDAPACNHTYSCPAHPYARWPHFTDDDL